MVNFKSYRLFRNEMQHNEMQYNNDMQIFIIFKNVNRKILIRHEVYQIHLFCIIKVINLDLIGCKHDIYFEQTVFSGFLIPQRIVSALMAFLSVALAYMLRISLSYAITQMVSKPHAHENGTVIINPDVCPPYEDELLHEENIFPTSITPSDTTAIYDWSQELQGLILSSFYWGYILTHVPGKVRVNLKQFSDDLFSIFVSCQVDFCQRK